MAPHFHFVSCSLPLCFLPVLSLRLSLPVSIVDLPLKMIKLIGIFSHVTEHNLMTVCNNVIHNIIIIVILSK